MVTKKTSNITIRQRIILEDLHVYLARKVNGDIKGGTRWNEILRGKDDHVNEKHGGERYGSARKAGKNAG